MESDKLIKIVERENERAEERAVAHAQDIIRSIIRLKGCIAGHEAEIAELQKELKALRVVGLVASDIIGE